MGDSKTQRPVRAAMALFVCGAATLLAAASAKGADPTLPLLQATAVFLNDHGGGSGWVLDTAQRLVVTSAHVVDRATKVEVVFPVYINGRMVPDRSFYARTSYLRESGLVFTGRVLDSDSRHDLAVVQLTDMPTTVQALPLADADAAPADPIHSLADPTGTTRAADMWSPASGLVRQVSGYRDFLDDGQFLASEMLISTLGVQPRDRGGPVVNDEGKLVGMCCVQVHAQAANRIALSVGWKAVKNYVAIARGLVSPQTAADYQRLGDRAVVERNWAKADDAYRKAIGLAPADLELRVDLAGVLASEGNAKDATTVLEQAATAGDPAALAWKAAGGVSGGLGPINGPLQPIDPPKTDLTASNSARFFRDGVIVYHTDSKVKSAAFAVAGPIAIEYLLLNPPYDQQLGFPTGNATTVKSSAGTSGIVQSFELGAIIEPTSGLQQGLAFKIPGRFWTEYQNLGGPGSKLGFPMREAGVQVVNGASVQFQLYEGGLVTWTPDTSGGKFAVQYGNPPQPAAPTTVADKALYEKLLQSIVYFEDDAHSAAGSGWVVDQANRLLITNFHMAGETLNWYAVFPFRNPKTGNLATNMRSYLRQSDYVVKNGLVVKGRVLYADTVRDLAVFQVDQLPPGCVALQPAGAPAAIGERIHTVANEVAAGSLWNYTQGTVAGIDDWRQNRPPAFTPNCWMLETHMPINHGDSGGAVVNDAGQLVGVNDRGFLTPAYNACIDLRSVGEFVELIPGLLQPKTADDYRRIASRFAYEKRWPEAEQAQRQAINLAPKTLPLQVDLAATLFVEGGSDKTLEAAKLLAGAQVAGDPAARVWGMHGGAQGELGPPLGNPGYNDLQGEIRCFQKGAIFTFTAGPRAGQSYAIVGATANLYMQDFLNSLWLVGFPISDKLAAKSPQGTAGAQQLFEALETVEYLDQHQQAHALVVAPPFLKPYQSLQGPASKLGFPTSNVLHSTTNAQVVQQNFEGGYMTGTNESDMKIVYTSPAGGTSQ